MKDFFTKERGDPQYDLGARIIFRIAMVILVAAIVFMEYVS